MVVFDDMHMTPWRANQAKAAVASFLEKGTREGDRVSLISTAGGAWWTSRMEAGRSKLIDMVKRFDGRLIPDMSPERMSDYEAMRIHVYRDPQVAERVLRRYDTYGVTNRRSRGGSQRRLDARRHRGRPDGHRPRRRGLLPGDDAPAHDARRDRARAQRARRAPRAASR